MAKVIKLTKIFMFDSAHFLPEHKGKCSAMHGHSYKLEVTVVRTNKLLISGGSSDGMVIDFYDLNAVVTEEVISKIDHKVLNDIYPFRTTAENIANHIFDVLAEKLLLHGVIVERIRLWETPDACVEVCNG
ncbi:6-carboxytetrahydropterin synthase QueD [Sporomusa sp.]|uniref:6-carboxytetrahydropterin synthase QueD n=1 Tax=Sporomusa sp. TaxID=2078658 RepID=UPI002C0FC018|nr:6-carboxytetrahydropterin synthase QueD [Sporomusa sp.]HWR08373.1 6-carboxytetrahydropterin synthase QueD [Sporomusa sp.]